MNDVLIIIQARLTSTRLPGKVLLPLGGKTVVERVYEVCKPVAETIVAIPDNAQNNALATFLTDKSIPFYRGQEHDVLQRYFDCASAQNPPPKVVVRITADCPLLSQQVLRSAISAHLNGHTNFVYTSNVVHRTFPKGFDCEVFDFELLKRAAKEATLPYDREHVTPYIRQISSMMNHVTQERNESCTNLCLDTEDDYRRLREIIDGKL